MTEATIDGVKRSFNSIREMGAYILLIQSMKFALMYESRGEDIPEDLLIKIKEKCSILLDKQTHK